MIEQFLKKHPSLYLADELSDICNPLSLLGINYFAHVNIDSRKQFSAISNSPHFTEHYLKNHYYTADIHMVTKDLGEYVLWDFVNLKGRSAQMHQEAGQFGIQHTFTIVQKNQQGGVDYYHFASKTSSFSINQFYISHLELLKVFILHFKNQINRSKDLSSAYNLKIISKENLADFSLEKPGLSSLAKSQFLEKLCLNKDKNNNHWFLFDDEITKQLTIREQQSLYYYIHGKSAREIANLVYLSKRTIEQHLENIKTKLNMKNKAELIENVIHRIFKYTEK